MSQRQSLIEQDKKKDEKYAPYVNERKEIDSKKDPYHIQAVQKIKSFLKAEEIADLRSRARQTKGTEDDKIVDRIDEIDIKVREFKDKAKGIKLERDTISKRLDGLRRIEKRFRSQDYDGSYSTFSGGFDINTLLIGYMLGKIDSSDINKQIDSSQHTRSHSYPSSSDYSSSHSSHDSYSSGGSFSSGSGFGGGGFSSGRGF